MASKAARINAITGIIVSQLDRERLDVAAVKLEIAQADSATDEQLSVLVYTKFLKSVGGDSAKLLECEFCHGRSPADAEECPYCKEVEADVKTASTQPVEAAKSIPTVEAQPMATAKNTEKNTEKIATVTSITKISKLPDELAKYTEKDLDAAVHEVQALKAKSARGYWDLGVKIADIYDRQIWKLRSEGGKPKYRTVEAFCNAELGLSPVHAWKLMEVAKNFSSAEVEAFGTSKLGLLLQAPEKDRPAIRAAVESGASKATIEQEVRKANKDRREQTGRDGKKKVQPKAGEKTKSGGVAQKRGRKASGNTITVASLVGNQTLPFYTKASILAANGDRKGWKKAKKISEIPMTTMEMDNDVMMTLTLMENTDGTLKIKVDIHRD